MPRISRVCAVGYPHHITQRGNNKQTVFFDEDDRNFYLQTLLRYREKRNLDIWAYCLMTNHVHLLAVPQNEISLARGIGGTNLLYTQYINRKYQRSGRLWQNRFFSSVVEKEPYLWAVARYIEQNPVRAKLVSRAQDYPWSSARAHVLGIKDEILSQDWLSEKEAEAYQEFLKDENEPLNTSIRKATRTGRPLGNEGFSQSLETQLQRRLLPKKAGRHKFLQEKI